VLDLRGIASFTDYFVIASGTNVRQVQAIADEVVHQLKHQGTRAARVEGYQKAEMGFGGLWRLHSARVRT